MSREEAEKRAIKLFFNAGYSDADFQKEDYFWRIGRNVYKIFKKIYLLYLTDFDEIDTLFGIRIEYSHENPDELKLFKEIKEE